MIDKIKHSLTCWITLDSTILISNDYLGYYQIVKCNICGKESIVFRINWEAILESFNDEIVKLLQTKMKLLNDYFNFKQELKENWYIIKAFEQEFIDYPIWEWLKIDSIIDNYWNIVKKNCFFDKNLTLVR